MSVLRLVGLIVVSFASARAAVAQDASAADARAFVAFDAHPASAFAHEVVTLRLRFGLETRLLAEDVIPLFRRALDLPVQLLVDGADASGLLPDGTRLVATDASREVDGPSLALGDDVVRVLRAPDEQRDGRTFAVFVLERRVSADAPGEIVLPSARLRFAYATRFRDDLVRGRVPEDRLVAEVSAAPSVLHVSPWPAGVPGDFGGAVGRFEVSASLAADERATDDSPTLVLRIVGDGASDVTRFDAPTLDVLAERFHVLGRREQLDGDLREIAYDLQPLRADVDAVPSLAFTYLDPGPPARWAVARTEAIALLAPRDGSATRAPTPTLPSAADEAVAFRDPRALPDVPPTPSASLAALVLVTPWLLALVFAARGRARERDLADPLGARARDAARAFARRVAAEPEALQDAFAGYLAARLLRPPAAVVTPTLAADLHRAGLSRELAERAARRLDELVAARYAGPSAPTSVAALRDDTLTLVDALESAFATREEDA